jgi:hypothetical protein
MPVAGRGNSGAFGLKEAARESRDKWAHSVLIEWFLRCYGRMLATALPQYYCTKFRLTMPFIYTVKRRDSAKLKPLDRTAILNRLVCEVDQTEKRKQGCRCCMFRRWLTVALIILHCHHHLRAISNNLMYPASSNGAACLGC